MTIDTTLPDPVALAGMTPSLRGTLAGIYRDYAAEFRRLYRPDDAHKCLVKASALEYGGPLDLSVLLEDA